MRTTIADGLFALNINYIRCAFGPSSIASRGLLFGAEITSQNPASERVVLSGLVLNRKLCPGFMPQNGMRFPLAGRLESASQFERLFRDAVSAEGLNRKPCPTLRRDSGTRFPLGPPSGKCIPF